MTDDEMQEWAEVLASGDEERIEAVKDRLLTAIYTKIMNEDLNDHERGWRKDN